MSNKNWYYTGAQQRSGLRQKILERDNYICQVCGKPACEVDHINPLAISHDRRASNLRAICIKCNRRLRRPRTLPPGHMPQIPWEKYKDYLRAELALCAK